MTTPTAWRCDLHGVWTEGDCPSCDDELIAMTEGAVCICNAAHQTAGTYSPDCLVHASWRCITSGCVYPAVDAHLCVGCGRRVGVRSGAPEHINQREQESAS